MERDAATERTTIGSVLITHQGGQRLIRTLLLDRLGSVEAVVDGTTVLETRSFDAFGKPRQGSYADANPARLPTGTSTPRGFTGHEHLDTVDVIHMNGRAYDPALGRFLGVDPIIQFPTNSQSLNPYSYILNNPLAGRDPTGYRACVGGGEEWKAGGCAMETGADTQGVLAAEAGAADSEQSRIESLAQERNRARIANGASRQATVIAGPVIPVDQGSSSERPESAPVFLAQAIPLPLPPPILPVTTPSLGDPYGTGNSSDSLGDKLTRALDQARYDEAQRVYVTYVLVRQNGPDVQYYVGRTSGFGDPRSIAMARYQSNVFRRLQGYEFMKVDKSASGELAKEAIRGREQQLLDYYAGVEGLSSPHIGNYIRAVAARNPAGYPYHLASNARWGELYPFTGKKDWYGLPGED